MSLSRKVCLMRKEFDTVGWNLMSDAQITCTHATKLSEKMSLSLRCNLNPVGRVLHSNKIIEKSLTCADFIEKMSHTYSKI